MMMDIHDEMEAKDFQKPSDIITETVCISSGLLANRYCNRTRQEVFILGTEPDRYCRVHRAPPPPPPPDPEEKEEAGDESENQQDPPVSEERLETTDEE